MSYISTESYGDFVLLVRDTFGKVCSVHYGDYAAPRNGSAAVASNGSMFIVLTTSESARIENLPYDFPGAVKLADAVLLKWGP